jgi:microsomal dipeptidase-like Zn-dependent dipeptidase
MNIDKDAHLDSDLRPTKSTALRVVSILIVLVALGLVLARLFVPAMVEKGKNVVKEHAPYKITQQAQQLHDSLTIMDWHGDSLLWDRDLSERSDYGHMDLPRMQQGNMGIQMFTTVTKAPSGMNLSKNDADARDNITLLSLVQAWPVATWRSLKARALYQSERLHNLASENPESLRIIRNQNDLRLGLQDRKTQAGLVLGLIGAEGAHALDGKLDALEELYHAGFRMIGLLHFFDNDIGGSLHGLSKSGLSDFGRDVVKRMNELGIIIDLAHSSEQVVRDVLALSTSPLVVSHTGIRGYCDSERNIPDNLMKAIADKGGVIGVGIWKEAICNDSPAGIAKGIKYGIELLGEDHISLGTDFDGAVTTSFDVSELAALTQALLDEGLSAVQITKIMGGNGLRFLLENLPAN